MADDAGIERSNRRADDEPVLSADSRESFHRDPVEDPDLAAKIAANQAIAQANELETENRILETELDEERDRANSNHFGLVFALCVLLAALVIGGFWLWGRMDRGQTIYAGSGTGRAVVVQPGTR